MRIKNTRNLNDELSPNKCALFYCLVLVGFRYVKNGHIIFFGLFLRALISTLILGQGPPPPPPPTHTHTLATHPTL